MNAFSKEANVRYFTAASTSIQVSRNKNAAKLSINNSNNPKPAFQQKMYLCAKPEQIILFFTETANY